MVPILEMRRFSCLLRLSLPPEKGEMAQTLMPEIEWLAALKCRATLLTTLITTSKFVPFHPFLVCHFTHF